MYHRYTNVAPDSHLTESAISSSIISNPADNPTVTSSRAFEAITIEDHAPAFTLAPVPATSATEMSSSWTASGIERESSPVLFALDASSTSIDPNNEITSSQRLTETIVARSSTSHARTRSTFHSSLSSTTSGLASPVNVQSAGTTGIIIGSVLGGLAVLMMISLAILYMVWRRRRRMPDKTDRENASQQRPNEEAASAAGGPTEERKRSTERPAAAVPRILRSEPIVVDAISPMSPIMPHLSDWTSEKADIPSPAGHHPVFASTHHYDHNDDEVSPCSCSSSSPSPSPGPPPPAAAEDAALGGFLFFDNSPSSRSSIRRPSTRDSSAPRTALSVPPPHRPPPRRRQTRAGGGHGRDDGGGGAARSTRGSGSSSVDGGDCVGVASSAEPLSLPPPLPVRSAARRKSLHNVERPAFWI